MKWLIWSNQQGMWWRADERGYTQVIEEAGRYERHDAERIVSQATCDWALSRTRTDPYTDEKYRSFDEVMVLSPESAELPMRSRLAGESRD